MNAEFARRMHTFYDTRPLPVWTISTWGRSINFAYAVYRLTGSMGTPQDVLMRHLELNTDEMKALFFMERIIAKYYGMMEPMERRVVVLTLLQHMAESGTVKYGEEVDIKLNGRFPQSLPTPESVSERRGPKQDREASSL